MTTHVNERAAKIGSVVLELSDYLDSLGRLMQRASKVSTPMAREALADCYRAIIDWIEGPIDAAVAKLLMVLESNPSPQGEAKPAIEPETMIAFSRKELAATPRVAAGQRISCRQCGGRHVLEEITTIDGGVSCLLIYHCGSDIFLGAIDGAAITQLPGDGA